MFTHTRNNYEPIIIIHAPNDTFNDLDSSISNTKQI